MENGAGNADAGATAGNPVFMPWFMGGPWVPKFSGKGGTAALREWRAQIEAFLRAQGLTGQQKVDFVLSALEGDAKREVLLVEEANRNTDNKIFALLQTFYGGGESVAKLRAQFFQYRQGAEESVASFTLKFRELHQRWRAVDAAPAGGDDEMLRAQFSMGLRPGPVQQELQRQLRRNPNTTFKDAYTEAKALERELDQGETLVCRTQTAPPASSAPTAPAIDPSWQRWRETLKAELQQEMKEQMSAMSKALMDDFQKICHQVPTGTAPHDRNPSTTAAPSRPRSSHASRATQSFQWDSQGQPICRDCGESGHIQRFCPRRRQPPSGF